jgi:hypothetical protein
VPGEGFEPPTFGLQNRCTATVLTRPIPLIYSLYSRRSKIPVATEFGTEPAHLLSVSAIIAPRKAASRPACRLFGGWAGPIDRNHFETASAEPAAQGERVLALA